jgi:hypothetical protein
MPDQFDVAFETLRGQQPPGPFAPPDAIRRRGRQRAHRQTLVIGLAVLVAIGGGVGWAAAALDLGPDRNTNPPIGTSESSTAPPTEPARSSTTPPGPAPTGSGGLGTAPADPAKLLLRVADLGPGNWQRFELNEPFSSADTWYWDSACTAYRSTDYPSLRHIDALATIGYRHSSANVQQHVTRYAPGWGAKALDDTRAVLARCATDATTRRAVLGGGFAGDESLLVREEGTGYVVLVAVVRVGDLVTLVKFLDTTVEAYARQVAARAADRLG